jgi:hypothetical protein
MKKIYEIDEWKFDKNVPLHRRLAKVSIHLKYPPVKRLRHLSPKERITAIQKHQAKNLASLVNTGLLGSYKILGTKKKPTGVETEMAFNDIPNLGKYNFIEYIFVESVKGGKKVVKKDPPRFFCIKMTVAIQVEGIKAGIQTYEERYVLIKARSFEEAYKKIGKQKRKYESPYLNPRGHLVRWKVESLDDCYETDIIECKNLDNPEGAEVYSVLRKRRMTKERYWNGKSN